MQIQVIASGSTGNAYRISDGHSQLLLDAGLPINSLRIRLRFGIADIDACLISHAHGDHSKGAVGLAKLGVDVYASRGTLDACLLQGHRFHALRALQQVSVGGWEVLPFDTMHDAPMPLGFVLQSMVTREKLLYLTDSYFCKYKFNGLTHVLVECNYDLDSLNAAVEAGYVPEVVRNRVLKSHMSLSHLVDMLRANDLSKVRQIYLLHLSKNNSNADYFKEEIQKVSGAEVYIA